MRARHEEDAISTSALDRVCSADSLHFEDDRALRINKTTEEPLVCCLGALLASSAPRPR